MDPTSLTLLGLDLYDIRKDKEESFECFVCVQMTIPPICRLTALLQTSMASSTRPFCRRPTRYALCPSFISSIVIIRVNSHPRYIHSRLST